MKLQVGIYGVKGEERKGTIWCLTSMIIPDATLSMGSFAPGATLPEDAYSEIMAAIGDLSAAGFEGQTLAEVFKEIKESVSETATDEEVGDVLDTMFGTENIPSGEPEVEESGTTASDNEVNDILNDFFG